MRYLLENKSRIPFLDYLSSFHLSIKKDAHGVWFQSVSDLGYA